MSAATINLRAMQEADLELVRSWLELPHVGRWWAENTVDAEIDNFRRCIRGAEPTTALIVTEDERPIGWCQWYLWASYPDGAAAMGAVAGEIGIDYAIGDPNAIGRGVGTALVARLVATLRELSPDSGLLADPDAANIASRRVLEKNGFTLVAVRPVATEPTDDPMAIYRRPPASP